MTSGCGDNLRLDPGEGPPADAPPEDAGAIRDANPLCPEPTSVLVSPWHPINTVATRGVTALGPNHALVDATAGGFMDQADNPFVYVRLSDTAATKVEITDTASYASDTAWDLAFKRAVIRINGGDSGPGGVELASVPAASLDDVTALPDAEAFLVDDWVTDDCMPSVGQIGEPQTAFGTWYDYDPATNRLAPMELVYVIRRPGGAAYKLRLLTFYGGPSETSGNYEIEWAPL